MRVVLHLPLPDPKVSPNRQVGNFGQRMAVARATKKMRQKAHQLALRATGGRRLLWKAARATAAFYWPDGRKRDTRNAEAMLKAYYDGIVDAGVMIDDDHLTLEHGTTAMRQDKNTPRVTITVECIELDRYGGIGRRRKDETVRPDQERTAVELINGIRGAAVGIEIIAYEYGEDDKHDFFVMRRRIDELSHELILRLDCGDLVDTQIGES